MTYILGSKCSDGILLLSDSRVTRGNDVNEDVKILQPIPNVVLAASGVTGIFTKFVKALDFKIQSSQIQTWDGLMNLVEDLSVELDQRYRKRVLGTIDVLIATKQSDKVELYAVGREGLAEEVKKWISIGHGEPYGAPFFKAMWNKDLTMKENAVIATFVLKIIDHYKLDNSVDANPQIWYIPFVGDIHQLTHVETDKIGHRAFSMYDELNSKLKKMVRPNEEKLPTKLEKSIDSND